MKKVLVVGSLNMDYTIYLDEFPLEGETIYGNIRYIQPGGKGENQAVALAKSNLVNVDLIGAIGKDKDGEEIIKVLNEFKVNHHLHYKECETGNATIEVNSLTENKIIIIEGANGKLVPSDIDVELIKNSDYILLQNEISQETNEFVILKAKEFNKTIFYNPAPYRKINNSILQNVDFFLPNKIEFKKYTGEENLEKGIKKLLDLGVKNIIVTLGTEGSILVNKDEKIKVNSCKVKAIDTVGAGDTYIGYFIASLASGKSLKESMEIASKASSITVSRKGSLISIPFGEEVYEK
jgi:ribokinase